MANKLKFKFETLPVVDTVLEDEGFLYRVVKARPHKNRFGEASMLVTLECTCAEAGCKFQHKVGRSVYYLPRRCSLHNKGWTKAMPFRDGSEPAISANAPQGAAVLSAASAKEDVRLFAKRVLRRLAGEDELDLKSVEDAIWRTFAFTFNDAELTAEYEAKDAGFDSLEDAAEFKRRERAHKAAQSELERAAKRAETLAAQPVSVKHGAAVGGAFSGDVRTAWGYVGFEGTAEAFGKICAPREDTDRAGWEAIPEGAKAGVYSYVKRRWNDITSAILFS